MDSLKFVFHGSTINISAKTPTVIRRALTLMTEPALHISSSQQRMSHSDDPRSSEQTGLASFSQWLFKPQDLSY